MPCRNSDWELLSLSLQPRCQWRTLPSREVAAVMEAVTVVAAAAVIMAVAILGAADTILAGGIMSGAIVHSLHAGRSRHTVRSPRNA